MTDAPTMLSHRELDAAAERAAAHLLAMGIRAEAKVAVIMADPVDVMTAVLGVHRIGATCAVLDARLSRRRTLDALERLSPDAVLTEPVGSAIERLRPVVGLG